MHYKTLLKWWSYYKEGGLERLLEWNVEGYQGKLTPEQEQIFLEELKKGKFKTQKEMIIWIKEKFGVEYSQQGISDMLIPIPRKIGVLINSQFYQGLYLCFFINFL